MLLPADPGLVLTVFSPEPVSPAADAITSLASWITTEHEDARAAGEEAVPEDPRIG